ncbi:Vancomycin resistance protein YoaR, contains peptidoglycan-binding and VanW domains [Nocardia amikacinitolerans]|nr:Vancomycin resistance protein YoaR, contains peptidoglycan-binding and VanW domains [Nocardia amikacinitolerans]
MTSESSTGHRGRSRQQDGEVGLRHLLESNREPLDEAKTTQLPVTQPGQQPPADSTHTMPLRVSAQEAGAGSVGEDSYPTQAMYVGQGHDGARGHEPARAGNGAWGAEGGQVSPDQAMNVGRGGDDVWGHEPTRGGNGAWAPDGGQASRPDQTMNVGQGRDDAWGHEPTRGSNGAWAPDGGQVSPDQAMNVGQGIDGAWGHEPTRAGNGAWATDSAQASRPRQAMNADQGRDDARANNPAQASGRWGADAGQASDDAWGSDPAQAGNSVWGTDASEAWANGAGQDGRAAQPRNVAPSGVWTDAWQEHNPTEAMNDGQASGGAWASDAAQSGRPAPAANAGQSSGVVWTEAWQDGGPTKAVQDGRASGGWAAEGGQSGGSAPAANAGQSSGGAWTEAWNESGPTQTGNDGPAGGTLGNVARTANAGPTNDAAWATHGQGRPVQAMDDSPVGSGAWANDQAQSAAGQPSKAAWMTDGAQSGRPAQGTGAAQPNDVPWATDAARAGQPAQATSAAQPNDVPWATDAARAGQPVHATSAAQPNDVPWTTDGARTIDGAQTGRPAQATSAAQPSNGVWADHAGQGSHSAEATNASGAENVAWSANAGAVAYPDAGQAKNLAWSDTGQTGNAARSTNPASAPLGEHLAHPGTVAYGEDANAEHATAVFRMTDVQRAPHGAHPTVNEHATAVVHRTDERAPHAEHMTEHTTAVVQATDTENSTDNRQRWDNARRSRPRPGPGESGPWWRISAIRRAGIAAGAVIAVGGLGYAVDAVLSSGDVPRGVVVAGIDVGGMDVDEADAKLRASLDGRAGQELPLQIGDVRAELTPSAAGLAVDWEGTWDRIGGQPINPFARVVSFFGTREVSVASTVDEAALDRQLAALRVHDRPTVEGTIQFQNGKPVAIPPVPGRVLDMPAARNALIDNWTEGGTLELPVVPAPLTVRPEAVQSALHDIAEPAVRGDVVFTGKGGDAVLTPEQIATVLSFAPDGQGGLAANYDLNAATAILAPQLAKSEVEAKDATFAVSGGAPRVVPAVVGDKINWPKTLEQLPTLLASAQQRSAAAVYEKIEPKLTTEAAQGLGIVEQMGAFTTSGFSGPSGVNIRTVAQKVNGAVVKPGETFSLNEFTGPRGTAEGYVESGIIDHGRPSTAVGGGISQFATTLYNAAYFAGLEDAGHTEHSYYISRYPAAREATVFDGAIDLKFRNNTQTGVYIETFATGSEITVRLWGTKTVDVESITGEKTKPTEPNTITLPKGKDCIASEGAPGFTITDTRVITDRKTGREVSRATRTVKYDPIPVVKCE